ncbi:hypothetical protein L0Y40_02410 [Candidatus Wolfebacteria bacterium]|nr:hypothetical protein [Candidatus Wolfebacteria bacterium]
MNREIEVFIGLPPSATRKNTDVRALMLALSAAVRKALEGSIKDNRGTLFPRKEEGTFINALGNTVIAINIDSVPPRFRR